MIKKAIAVRSHSPMAVVLEVYEQVIVRKRFLFWHYNSVQTGKLLCAGTLEELSAKLKGQELTVWDVEWEKGI